MASPTPNNIPAKLGVGCLVLFALPFAGFGLLASAIAIKELYSGKWQSGLAMLIFGVVFSSVGFGLMIFGVRGGKKAAQQKAIEVNHPNEPWLWREDWARHEVKSAGKGGLIFVSAFALFWNVVSGAVCFAVLNQPHRS